MPKKGRPRPVPRVAVARTAPVVRTAPAASATPVVGAAILPMRRSEAPRAADPESASETLFDHYERLTAAGDRGVETLLQTARVVARDWEMLGRQAALFGLYPLKVAVAGVSLALAPDALTRLMAPHLQVARAAAETWLAPRAPFEPESAGD